MKEKIVWKFLGAFIFLILISVLILNFFVSLKLRDYYEEKISDKLLSNALLAGKLFETNLTEHNLTALQKATQNLADQLSLRITVITPGGEVLSDSEKDPRTMENHSDRLEISKAIKRGEGQSIRFSDTLGYNMKYVAQSVKMGDKTLGVVRLSMPLSEVEEQIQFIYRIVLIGGIIAVIITLIIGYLISRGISRPIAEMKEIAERIAKGDFSKRASLKTQDELGQLAKSLNQMADELQNNIDSLKKMNQVRTDFVANVSHELKTPLTSIKGFVETLEDGAINDKETATRFLSIIKKHTNQLTSIVDDLLSLTELEYSKEKIEKKEFNLKDLLNEVILGFGHALSQKEHKLETNFEGENFDIQADKLKLEQVIVNLIANAIKYTKEKGNIQILLSDKNNALIFTVEDNGIGIPKEHLDRIFERFYRVDKARSRKLGGTGLGLSIVKHIVTLHKGSVDVVSQMESGTKVTVLLPKS